VEFLIVLAVLFAVVFVVTGPLRRPERAGPAGGADSVGAAGAAGPAAGDQERESQLAELEALREAKYREIRDTELDHATGKLSRADFEAVDGRLRAEALEILRELDRVAPAGEVALEEDRSAGGKAGSGAGEDGHADGE
jgi:hypothetical protein